MRIDLYLIQTNLAKSRNKAQQMIKDGLVFVDGKKVEKASANIADGQEISVAAHKEYVSRGAKKLLAGLESFQIDLTDKIVIDLGASTGGFTQVALEKGAAKVYAVDVGASELDQRLTRDKRVKNLCNTDIRKLEKADVVDANFYTCDLSFVSLTKILPQLFEKIGFFEGIFLFKPQFECGKDIAKKFKGVIKDKKIHLSLLKSFENFLNQNRITISGITFSPITGGDGNIEYLFYLNGKSIARANYEALVEKAFLNAKN